VANWAIENFRAGNYASILDPINTSLTDQLNLIFELSRLLNDTAYGNSIERIQDTYAGLSTSVEVFQAGEQLQAKQWLTTWINKNTKNI
jgi:hypothetical protein